MGASPAWPSAQACRGTLRSQAYSGYSRTHRVGLEAFGDEPVQLVVDERLDARHVGRLDALHPRRERRLHRRAAHGRPGSRPVPPHDGQTATDAAPARNRVGCNGAQLRRLQRRATASVATDTCSSSPDIPPRTASPSADSVSRFCSGAALLPENKQPNKQTNNRLPTRFRRGFDRAHGSAQGGREGRRAAPSRSCSSSSRPISSARPSGASFSSHDTCPPHVSATSRRSAPRGTGPAAVPVLGVASWAATSADGPVPLPAQCGAGPAGVPVPLQAALARG